MKYVAPPVIAVMLVLVLVLGAAAASELPASAAASASSPDAVDQPTAKMSPLLALVLKQVISMAVKEVVSDPSGLFRQLAERHFGFVFGVSGPPSPPRVEAVALAPVVGYSIEQLDPLTFASLKSLDVEKRAPSLRTGDVFAVRYSTNLPGQVRLENIDPAGIVNDLGTYTVTPDQLNRIPSDLGIKLVGQPGTEVIRFYFFPCMPQSVARDPWATALRGKLPDCGRGQNPAVQAAVSGTIRPKALVNLSQPEASMSFAGSASYQMNDVTSTVALINHEAR